MCKMVAFAGRTTPTVEMLTPPSPKWGRRAVAANRHVVGAQPYIAGQETGFKFSTSMDHRTSTDANHSYILGPNHISGMAEVVKFCTYVNCVKCFSKTTYLKWPKLGLCDPFWATVCKTVRPMLLDRCPVMYDCLSVCDVSALSPNG